VDALKAEGGDDAFFGLLHLGTAAIPLLIDEAEMPENRPILPSLVEVIWQTRSSQAIPFLSKALRDPEPEVWKSALDGLVTIGGPDAVRALRIAIDDIEREPSRNEVSKEWLCEALEQIGALT